jgi:hypothetical protein
MWVRAEPEVEPLDRSIAFQQVPPVLARLNSVRITAAVVRAQW